METQLAELSKRHTNNIKLLRQVKSKHLRCQREMATSKAVTEELARQGDRPVYRALGKVFVLSSRDNLSAEAARTAQEREAELSKYKKQAEFLMTQVKQNEQQMMELINAGARR